VPPRLANQFNHVVKHTHRSYIEGEERKENILFMSPDSGTFVAFFGVQWGYVPRIFTNKRHVWKDMYVTEIRKSTLPLCKLCE
jgi:hypothetical protein